MYEFKPYEHISLIYNPFAGGLRGGRIERLDRAERALQLHAKRVTRHASRGPRTLGEVAKECIAAGSDLIYVAGGDGTMHEVAEGMIGTPVPLGVLPAGTANVLATELGLGGSMERAAQALARCVPTCVRLGKLTFESGTCQNFLLMAGAGLDAHIVRHLEAGFKRRFGKMSYWLSGVQQFGRRLEEFEVETDGTRRRCSFALISKVRNYGGDLEIARTVRLTDTEFEVVLFAGANSLRYVVYLAGVAANGLRGLGGVTVYRAREVRLLPRDGDVVHLQVDGEYAGQLPATVTAGNDCLQVMIPKWYLAR